MDRLTHYDVNGVAQITPGYCEAAANMQAIQRLAAYEDAESEGRLIVLPCKVGDTVYQQDGVELYESVISNIMLMGGHLIFDTPSISFDETAIGSSIYLTRAEAEAALKEAERRATAKLRWCEAKMVGIVCDGYCDHCEEFDDVGRRHNEAD